MLDADIDSEGFERRVKSIADSTLKDSAMTLAQRLTQKGLEKGRQEGLQEAISETLAIRFGAVPEGLAEAIRNVDDESRLRALHQASLRVDTMDEFTREL